MQNDAFVAVIAYQLLGLRLIRREIHSLGALIELGNARGEFVRQLGRTPLWPKLAVAAGTGCAAVRIWLRGHHIDAPWMREWVNRVAPFAPSEPTETPPSIDHVLFKLDIVPEPDLSVMREASGNWLDLAFAGWLGDEPAPDPINENRDDFLGRMGKAWDRRVNELGGPNRPRVRRELERHAHWLVRHRICGCSVTDIVAEDPNPPEDSTVRKALKSYAELIELDD